MKWIRFWRLTVIWDWITKKNYNRYLICKCDCGIIKEIAYSSLTLWTSKSCWCLRKELSIKRFTTHWMRRTRLYNTWCNMKKRCKNKNNPAYKNYWWRWIFICKDRDSSFTKFKERSITNWYSDQLEIDRIDNNWNYSPDNCRWVDSITQNRNRRDNVLITHNWITKTLSARIADLWLNKSTISDRIYLLWRDYKKALFTKIRKKTAN